MVTRQALNALLGAIVILGATMAAVVHAHEVLYRGTVLAVQPTRLQVKTIDEKTKKEEPVWFSVGKDTKVKRGDKAVPYTDAKIANGERIVVVVNHDAEGKMLAAELRLAAK